MRKVIEISSILDSDPHSFATLPSDNDASNEDKERDVNVETINNNEHEFFEAFKTALDDAAKELNRYERLREPMVLAFSFRLH